jgi:hypothetical protein
VSQHKNKNCPEENHVMREEEKKEMEEKKREKKEKEVNYNLENNENKFNF